MDAGWAIADSVVNIISRPKFRDAEYELTAFGANPNDNVDDLGAFTAAIAKCNSEGGGTIRIRPGIYDLKGPIHFKSNIQLQLAEGAILKFSTDPADYLPVVLTRWEGVELYNYSPLVYALDCENIAITGRGVLDGQADNEHWWPWKGNKRDGWQEGDPSQQLPSSRERLIAMNRDQTPPEERLFGSAGYLRPDFLQTHRCRNVWIEGITLKNSPMWVVHPVLCENVIVENMTVISHGPNNDGCDPESSRNVLIQNCVFDTGDDCIALKSGRNQDGWRINRPTEYVVIRNCVMKDGHGGVVIGSEVSGGCRHIYAENCQMNSPNLDRAIRIKTNRSRGGVIENLFFRNITVGEVAEAVVKVNMQYTLDDTLSISYPVIRNIFVDHVTAQKSKYGVSILGIDDEHTISNVAISDCHFNAVAEGNVVKYIDTLMLYNVNINGIPWTAMKE